jgi:hypothetical protein
MGLLIYNEIWFTQVRNGMFHGSHKRSCFNLKWKKGRRRRRVPIRQANVRVRKEYPIEEWSREREGGMEEQWRGN